jgi:hypothetical protein
MPLVFEKLEMAEGEFQRLFTSREHDDGEFKYLATTPEKPLSSIDSQKANSIKEFIQARKITNKAARDDPRIISKVQAGTGTGKKIKFSKYDTIDGTIETDNYPGNVFIVARDSVTGEIIGGLRLLVNNAIYTTKLPIEVPNPPRPKLTQINSTGLEDVSFIELSSLFVKPEFQNKKNKVLNNEQEAPNNEQQNPHYATSIVKYVIQDLNNHNIPYVLLASSVEASENLIRREFKSSTQNIKTIEDNPLIANAQYIETTKYNPLSGKLPIQATTNLPLSRANLADVVRIRYPTRDQYPARVSHLEGIVAKANANRPAYRELDPRALYTKRHNHLEEITKAAGKPTKVATSARGL